MGRVDSKRNLQAGRWKWVVRSRSKANRFGDGELFDEELGIVEEILEKVEAEEGPVKNYQMKKTDQVCYVENAHHFESSLHTWQLGDE